MEICVVLEDKVALGRGRGGNSGSRGRNTGGGRGRGSANFDPLACYQYGVHGHLARDYPQLRYIVADVECWQFWSHSWEFNEIWAVRPKERTWSVEGTSNFGGLNVVYDDEGNEYPIDNARSACTFPSDLDRLMPKRPK